MKLAHCFDGPSSTDRGGAGAGLRGSRIRCLTILASCLSIGSLSVAIDVGTAEAASSASSVVQASSRHNVVQNRLVGVSCTSSIYCVAVGSYVGATDHTLIETWNGVAWSVSPSPNEPSGANFLHGVSCTSSVSCVAVGDYYESSNVEQTLVESWDGTAWSIVPSPNTSGSSDALSGVSCTATTDCMAVGASYLPDETLIESWDGTAWSIVPSPPNENSLEGVSCTSSTVCMAAGQAGSTPLVESWDGTTWSVSLNSNPGVYTSTTYAVSCASSTECVAVGDYQVFPQWDIQPLSETWNGIAWSNTSDSSQINFVLTGVSCTGTIFCSAVGFVVRYHRPSKPLTETWNGTAWSVVPNPGSDGLGGVSCADTNSCVAVGITLKGKTQIESWDGTAWSVVASPNPVTIDSFKPTSGPPGTKVVISGANLRHARSVTFDGVKATITSDEANRLVVTVPSSATTGVIQVTTQSGTATSTSDFTVT